MVASYFVFLSVSVLEGFIILIMCSFLPCCHFIGIYFLVAAPYNPLYFCGVHCNFYFYITNFIELSHLPYFLGESGQRFTNFAYILKEPAFKFIVLYYSGCCLYLFHLSALIFMILSFDLQAFNQLINFYWRIATLQYCNGFCHTSG